MREPNEPRPRKSVLGWSVLVGSAVLALVGALAPQPSDLNVVTGAVFGFVLGALVVCSPIDLRVGRDPAWQRTDAPALMIGVGRPAAAD